MDAHPPVPTRTAVQLYGEYSGESCGYCTSGRSVSFGMKSTQMAAEDYEALMYRGFRRCGDFYYKPAMHKVSNFFCCVMICYDAFAL